MMKWFVLMLMVVAGNAIATVEFKGEFTQGGMIIGKTEPGNTVMFNGDYLRITKDGHFVFGFGRDTDSGDVIIVQSPKGEYYEEHLQIKKREYDIQKVNGIDKKIQSKSKTPETWARIKKEQQAVKLARKDHVERTDFAKPFKWPLIGPITGVFGSQRVYNGEPGRPHYGVDVSAPVGTKVYAPQSGIVTLAHQDMYYSGGTLIIDHGYGISSTFLHLSEVLVSEGDEIKQGDLIAKVGAGGRASGPHLDWRMNWYGRRIDPQLIVPPMETLLETKP